MTADHPLPFDVAVVEKPQPQEEPMSALTIGGTIEVPELAGRWSVWSMTNETPGGYFLVPADDAARATEVKYAVIKATQLRGEAKPNLALVRTVAA